MAPSCFANQILPIVHPKSPKKSSSCINNVLFSSDPTGSNRNAWSPANSPKRLPLQQNLRGVFSWLKQATSLAVKLSNHNMLDNQAYQDGRIEVDFALVEGNMHDVSSDQVFYNLAFWSCEFVDIAIWRIFWDLLKVEKLDVQQSTYIFASFGCSHARLVWRVRVIHLFSHDGRWSNYLDACVHFWHDCCMLGVWQRECWELVLSLDRRVGNYSLLYIYRRIESSFWSFFSCARETFAARRISHRLVSTWDQPISTRYNKLPLPVNESICQHMCSLILRRPSRDMAVSRHAYLLLQKLRQYVWALMMNPNYFRRVDLTDLQHDLRFDNSTLIK